jgi:hypothetical protein
MNGGTSVVAEAGAVVRPLGLSSLLCRCVFGRNLFPRGTCGEQHARQYQQRENPHDGSGAIAVLAVAFECPRLQSKMSLSYSTGP